MAKPEIVLTLTPEARDALSAFSKKHGRTMTSLMREGLQLAADKYGFSMPDLSSPKDYARRLAGPSFRLQMNVADTTAADIRALAAKSGQSFTEVVRRALETYIHAPGKNKSAA